MKQSVGYVGMGALLFVGLGAFTSVRHAKADGGGHATRSMNADSDPAQWIGGTVSTTAFPESAQADVAVGPFYLTDVHAVDGQSRLFTVAANGACTDAPVTLLWHVSELNIFSPTPGQHPIHGARYFIKQSEKLCAKNETNSGNPSIVSWAGFRPYS